MSTKWILFSSFFFFVFCFLRFQSSAISIRFFNRSRLFSQTRRSNRRNPIISMRWKKNWNKPIIRQIAIKQIVPNKWRQFNKFLFCISHTFHCAKRSGLSSAIKRCKRSNNDRAKWQWQWQWQIIYISMYTQNIKKPVILTRKKERNEKQKKKNIKKWNYTHDTTQHNTANQHVLIHI